MRERVQVKERGVSGGERSVWEVMRARGLAGVEDGARARGNGTRSRERIRPDRRQGVAATQGGRGGWRGRGAMARDGQGR